MEPYLLPDTLRSGPEMARLNRELRAGRTELDWSRVGTASDAALSQLLAGLHIGRDEAVLGFATLRGPLEVKVINALTRERTPRSTSSGTRAPIPLAPKRLQPPTPSEIRDELHQLVLGELVGPTGGPEEEVDERAVRERYIVGALAPRQQVLPPEEDDQEAPLESSSEEPDVEPESNMRESMLPSSLGLSFYVEDGADLSITARWGRYERTPSESLETDAGEPKAVWLRVPVECGPASLTLEERDLSDLWHPDPETPDVVVRGQVRRHDGGWVVTLFLVNGQRPPRLLKDSGWLFQAGLQVEAAGAAVFMARPQTGAAFEIDAETLDESRAMAMLYRRHAEFAAGHGTSVHAEVAPDRPDRAVRLITRAAPWYDVPQTTARDAGDTPELEALTVDMKSLSTMDRAEVIHTLRVLPRTYIGWIEQQKQRLDAGQEGLQDFRDIGADALAHCRIAAERIDAGIDVLERDETAFDAFRFMNRVMWQQRIHSVLVERVRSGERVEVDEVDLPGNRSWRLFQLAFILLNLPGITDLTHGDRAPDAAATADLLWFPTGGGKTEAYLGLTAYTLAVRRLQGVIDGHDGGYGVAVLMRYTLRLLTLQQFQRAAALLCACELERKEAWFDGDERWGREPFRIGLWVGQKTTPNKTEGALEAIKADRGNHGGLYGGSGTPAQLTNCPWCGAAIDPGVHITVESFTGGRGRTILYCGDASGRCPFSARQAEGEGLPVLVVDEEIYRFPPALLISTVDKFAQMPWKGETRMLFGRFTSRCERHGFRSPDIEDADSHPARAGFAAARTRQCLPARPPDLIIQDELHLISGPLGTLTGLYETAVDELSSWEAGGRTIRPKVIASTATIRRAASQVHGLFLRKVAVFPPHGLDVEDNFFALQRPTGEKYPGRRYLGVTAQGRRMKAILIRVYVAHLAAAQTLYERYGAPVDPWMTLVGYFGSLRELGGMRRMVDDDVNARLRSVDRRGFANRKPVRVEELTSRRSSTEIPEILSLLEQRFNPEEGKVIPLRGRKKTAARRPVDVLLATNMLSVGVDVQRLGLMVVAGQPKTTAEYIQATSRVGRRFPGLICTVFNWVRPRDLSHYERFEHYHATFYDQVEALSVTPFASRARDRGLTALLISLVRLHSAALNANRAAGSITVDDPWTQAVMDRIVDRAYRVTGSESVRESVRAELETRLEAWLAQATRTEGGRELSYAAENNDVSVPLLSQPGRSDWNTFTCLTSLRDVEPEINLILDDHGMDVHRVAAVATMNPIAAALLGRSEEERIDMERRTMEAVMAAMTPELKDVDGFLATEVTYYLLGGYEAGYEPRRGSNRHWYLGRGDVALDVPHGFVGPEESRYDGAPRPFYTTRPSKRARGVIERLSKRPDLDIPGVQVGGQS